MNREDAFNFDPRPRQDQEASNDFGPRDWDPGSAQTAGGGPGAPGGARPSPTGMWDLIELFSHRWGWLLLGGLVLAAGGCGAGLRFWHTGYTGQAQLVFYESPNPTEGFHPRQTTLQTLAGLLRTPEVLGRAAAQARPPPAK